MSFPSPADDYVEVGLNWNQYLIRHPAATFPVQVVGKAMEPTIAEGSHILVDKSLDPRNNDIIVAIYRDEFTIRRYVKNEKGRFLISENPKFPTIQLKPDEEIQIWGVVTFSITSHRAL
ncbi:MAG: translesion error-prone DNA polymerase V autoproteolytic subunit [Proteobacteria bacterium]|jgi:DNA polymerase V|nr:translesion error-prone DNA polymerase V autoproteolytic subunit [Pseudomonadota bacterium]